MSWVSYDNISSNCQIRRMALSLKTRVKLYESLSVTLDRSIPYPSIPSMAPLDLLLPSCHALRTARSDCGRLTRIRTWSFTKAIIEIRFGTFSGDHLGCTSPVPVVIGQPACGAPTVLHLSECSPGICLTSTWVSLYCFGV